MEQNESNKVRKLSVKDNNIRSCVCLIDSSRTKITRKNKKKTVITNYYTHYRNNIYIYIFFFFAEAIKKSMNVCEIPKSTRW